MATYVISDLHGQYKMFKKLLERATFSDEDYLYMLGDAIDRGPDGIKILQHVMKASNMEFLLGNHEFMMLNSVELDGTAPKYNDFLYGRDADLWIYSNGGNKTYDKYKRLKKADRMNLLDWMLTRSLSTKVNVKGNTFLLTHSFFDTSKIDVPYNQMDYQTIWDIVWQSPFRWDLYVENKEYTKYKPWTFIVGHVPTCYADEKEEPRPLSTYKEGNIIDIDGGCARHDEADAPYKGAILLRLDDLKEFTLSFAEFENK